MKSETFNDEYMRKREYLIWRAPMVGSAIQKALQPMSVVDVGCSVGEFVKWFNENHIYSIGIDFSEDAYNRFKADKDAFWMIDMTEKNLVFQQEQEKFDLAICFEVGGILEGATNKQRFANNLSKLSNKMLFAVGADFQPEWKRRFLKLGFTEDASIANQIRDKLEIYRTKPAIKAIYNGIMFFTK